MTKNRPKKEESEKFTVPPLSKENKVIADKIAEELVNNLNKNTKKA